MGRSSSADASDTAINPIKKTSIHRITSGQVVIDLQTAVKELVENGLDAGATNIEVRFKQHGLTTSIEVIDNGNGIPEQYHDNIALKHHTLKLSSFSDLFTVRTFGFRGEALSSLCALSESLVVITVTEQPMGVSLEMEASGKILALTNLSTPLLVRRKEFEQNSKCEFGEALALLNAYALGPCCTGGAGVRLTVSNQVDKGQKTVQLRTSGASSIRASVFALWRPKALDNMVDFDWTFEVDRDRTSLQRLQGRRCWSLHMDPIMVTVTAEGFISKFTVAGGRTGADREFFYVNGRPCNLPKIQKAFNGVYRSFIANQAPFILADTILPTNSCDTNVSPDKRTIFLHSEKTVITKLKAALEETFAPSRSTYDVGSSQTQRMTQSTLFTSTSRSSAHKRTRSEPEDVEEPEEDRPGPTKKRPVPSTSPLHRGLGHEFGCSSSCYAIRISTRIAGLPPQLAGSPTISQMDGADAAKSNRSPIKELSSPSSPAPFLHNLFNGNISPTVSQMVNAYHEEAMDIDEDRNIPDGPPSPGVRLSAKATAVVVDTTSVVWSAVHPEKARLSDDDKGKGLSGTNGTSVPQRRHFEGVTASSDAERGGRCRRRSGGLRERDAIDKEEKDQLDSSDHLQCAEESAGHGDHIQRHSTMSPTPADIEDDAGHSSSKAIGLTSDDDLDDSHLTSIFEDSSSTLQREETVPNPEVIRTSDQGSGDVTLHFDLSRISDIWRRLSEEITSTFDIKATSLPRVPLDAGVSNTENDQRAVDALARVIDKKDFANMGIIGQFTLGFIVMRRRKTVRGEDDDQAAATMDDLFIVDQHAADEKYNFETLQQTTSINSQRLFRPQAMELIASDELLAIENMDVLRQNGFEVEELDEDESRQGARLRLTAQPVKFELASNDSRETNAWHFTPLLAARVLGYLLIYAPAEEGRSLLSREIVSSIDNEALHLLGRKYNDDLIRVFQRSRDVTPQVLTEDEREDISDSELAQLAKDNFLLRRRALIRDGFQLYTEPGPNAPRTMTRAVHIIPVFEKINATGVKPVLSLIERYGGISVTKELMGKDAHRLENLITLRLQMHSLFRTLTAWLEKTSVPNQYRIQATYEGYLTGYPNGDNRIITFSTRWESKLPPPSPRYIALHAACAKTAFMSGVGQWNERIMEDLQWSSSLDSEGHSADLLAAALTRVDL
ncbi:hypothetical protein D9615_008580 [Tricholomella constricta]|uniref:Uncharacterized protein n=1 Tax=Tricholomella constricta TaxID=117010 RepID=A0A8H5M0S1_9AGAR|nr:hypothetical protein D9615_008580 [Tricholomella constricta]